MYGITEPIVQLLGIGLEVSGSASLTGESALTSDGFNVAFAEVSLSAQSDSSATAIVGAAAESALVAESSLVADGVTIIFAESALSAELTVVAGLEITWQGEAAMSAEVTLTADPFLVAASASIVIGASNLTASMSFLVPASPRAMRSASNLTAEIYLQYGAAGRPMVGSSNLTATVYTPSKYLVLPTIELAYTNNVLLERYPIDNGQSLLITNNIGVLQTFPAQEEIADADYYFRGGSENILDDESEAAVIAAGYGEYIVTQ